MVTNQVTKIITERSSVPTIGIGSGKDCDGQVLVVHDMLGMFEKIKPKFAKRYLSLSEEIRNAVKSYVTEVKEQTFPADNNEFKMDETEYNQLRKEIV
jgi:3-methyl-2-oxobutanoate hydroxymethyltransferase